MNSSSTSTPQAVGRAERRRRGAHRFFVTAPVVLNIVLGTWYVFTSRDSFEAIVPAHAALRFLLADLLVVVLLRTRTVADGALRSATAIGRAGSPATRRFASAVEGYDGLHVGFACSALLWFVVMNVAMWRSDTYPPTCFAVNGFLVVAFAGAHLSAIRSVRLRMPEIARVVHRIVAWLLIGLLWLQADFVLLRRQRGIPWREAVLPSPEFWLLVAMSLVLVLPWMRVRRVPIEIVHVSGDVVLVRLGLKQPPPAGSLATLSRSLLGSRHRAAQIVEQGRKGAVLALARRSDWVSDLVDFPQPHVWLHASPVLSASHANLLHPSVVLVATGTAIAEALGRLAQAGAEKELVWVVRDPLRAYSPAFVDDVRRRAPGVVVVDTVAKSDVDVVSLVLQRCATAEADAVDVVGSDELAESIREGLDGVRADGVRHGV